MYKSYTICELQTNWNIEENWMFSTQIKLQVIIFCVSFQIDFKEYL